MSEVNVQSAHWALSLTCTPRMSQRQHTPQLPVDYENTLSVIPFDTTQPPSNCFSLAWLTAVKRKTEAILTADQRRSIAGSGVV